MERSLVIKVQYGETLRRFSSHVVDGKLDIDMIELRNKIFSLFSFPACSEVDFTYVDEDGDVVKLADDEDLLDIMRQRLSPLRITVRLNTERSLNLRPQDRSSGSLTSVEPVKPHGRSTGSLTPVEPVRPHGRSTGSLTRVEPLPLQLPLQVGNTTVSEVLNSLPATVRETVSKFSNELGLDTSSPAGYLVILNFLAKMGLTYLKEASAAGAKSGPSESSTDAPVTKDKNSSISVGTTQVFELKNLATDKGNTAGNCQSSVMQAMDSAIQSHISPTAPNPFYDSRIHSGLGFESTKVGQSGPKMKSVQKAYESHPGWTPFSGRTIAPHMQRHQLPANLPSLKRNHNVLHVGIQCDGCGLHPITGPRFKSKVKEDYDLCVSCFNVMGNEAEYIRMDLPMNYRSSDPSNFRYPHCMGRSQTCPADHAKLDSCFILDVNIFDGTIIIPLSNFTKIWRMRNNGAVAWPRGTNLLWIGGDQLSKAPSCDLKLPAEGCPVDKEIDIAVNFTAPENPGRYVSYWRMVSPSGYQFGQRVWVLIQVDSPLKGSNSKNRHDFNLNFPPVTNGIMGLQNVNASIGSRMMGLQEGNASIGSKMMGLQEGKASVGRKMMGLQKGNASIDTKMMGFPNVKASIDTKIGNDIIMIDTPTGDKGLDLLNKETLLVAGVKLDLATPEASSLVTDPAVDQSKVERIAISVSENSEVEDPSSMMEVNNSTDEVEQTLLKELENMGFTQIDLNKEILRKNEYDLEEALNELCDTEWDPMLAELQEMGFSNNEVNKKLLKKNNGSIKRVVMDLIAGEDE